MSRIGKKPIAIPDGVEISVNGSFVLVKGAKGELKSNFPGTLEIKNEDKQVFISPKNESDTSQSRIWGLHRALLRNMIIGVSQGFQKELEFSGIGFKAAVKDGGLELSLGFSHPVFVKTPEGINFKVEKNTISVSGIEKEKVGQIAAQIKSLKKPEPYKGTGIIYKGEIIIRKAGKKAATTAG